MKWDEDVFRVFSVFFGLLFCVQALDVPETCYDECASRVVFDESDFDVACNDTCKLLKCHRGCDLWIEGTSSSCQDVCGEEISTLNKQWNLYCVRGCNIAISTYIKKIENDLDTPSAPYLVAYSRTNDSITVQWASGPFSNISYLIQWRYDSLNLASDWEYYKPLQPVKNNQLKVDGLQPYTKYKFRVAWILLPPPNYGPLFSEESLAISTLPYGVPSVPPTITCLTAVGYSRVSVSWEPPTFPNGPILSYVLHIREYPSGFIAFKDISDTSGGLHYMFNHLNPSRLYIISVATRNNMGEGPADTRNVSTPSREEISSYHTPQPFLVFAEKQNAKKQGLLILDEIKLLYQSKNNSLSVTGIGIHVKHNAFFISDSIGNIWQFLHISSMETTSITPIMQENTNFPSLLSVDWLHEKLYMVESNQISRCNFTGENYEVVLTGFQNRPTDMHADPYNGYLYWVINSEAHGGLYRIDLDFIESNTVTLDKAQQIVKDNKLMAFTIDYINFRLLLPFADENTMLSVALDGTDEVNIRRNSQSSKFTNVRSIAVHQNRFYWTTGKEIFGEEYHHMEDKYYHNIYPIEGGPFSCINIHHLDTQPHPVPLNPVEAVQAVFESDMAKIMWTKPRLIGGLGKGAYQKWLYEVHLYDFSSHLTIYGLNISHNQYVLHNLRPNTTYSVKVRAYSLGGKGPWSSEFTGRTLKYDSLLGYPYVLWSAREGLLKSNIVGENVEPLIHKINLNNAHITDMSWYNELLFLNTNASFVFVYNMSSHHSLHRLANITNAASIAVDWFAPKLYWSSPMQQMISRANLDGSQSEPLPILTMAKKLAIDSRNGYLYWATSHSVECSRLNGEDHFTYMKNELFSGKHVMGLTLDFDMNNIYWMVRSYEGCLIYKAPLASYNFSITSKIVYELVGPLPEDDVRGPLWYFSDRLFWLHEHKESLLSDMHGLNIASLKGLGLNGLRTLAVIDPSLQPFPSVTKHDVMVVPNSVKSRTIRCIGSWDSFNITWEPTFVNYGSLFYEMKVNDGEEIYTMVTEEPIFVYPSMRLLSPYMQLTVAIKSYTYWASSRQTVVSIYSPMSVPTKPLNPRIFITYKSPIYGHQNIQANFRWSAPEPPNGIILGYKIKYWIIQNGSKLLVSSTEVVGDKLQFEVKDLVCNSTYYFQVTAYTSVGEGPPSDVVEAQTSHQSPVPQLLLAKTDAVNVADIDTHEQKLLSAKATHPAAIAYLAIEKKVFWIEEEGALMVSSLDGKTNTSLIKSLSSKGTSLAVDWISRHIYWAEVDKDNEHSSVWSLDLNRNGYSQSIFNQSAAVGSLEVEPFSGSLLWTMKNGKYCQLMICDSNGYNVRPFFWQPMEYQTNLGKFKVKRTAGNKTCNCAPRPTVGKAITVDNSNSSQPEVLWVDGRSGHIWSSDLQGCNCKLLVNASEIKDNGLPPSSLTVDSSHIYWSNKTIGRVYSMSKRILPSVSSSKMFSMEIISRINQHHVTSEAVRGVRGIRAIGEHLQPYPDVRCLSPNLYQKTAKLVSRSPTSLMLHLPPVEPLSNCSKLPVPSVLYTVYFSKYNATKEHVCGSIFTKNSFCNIMKTHNSTFTLYNLTPFTNYSIKISASNYYSKGMTVPGPPVIFQTREGVPSVPLNVSANAATPFKISVFWKPPSFPNGHPIYYEVRWRTKNSLKSGQSSVYTDKPNTSGNHLSMALSSLEPGTDYFIMVRAYSSNWNLHNDSNEILVATYQLPNNLTQFKSESNSLIMLWQSPNDSSISFHGLQYAQVSSNALQWNSVFSGHSTTFNMLYNLTVNDLLPKVDYYFQLILTYQMENDTISWPTENFFLFQTQGDKPSAPGDPQVHTIGRDVYQVTWDEAENYGDEELIYELQMRSKEGILENWITVSNGSHTQWIMESMSVNTNYEFRVRAVNEYGGSNFSFSVEPFFLPEPGAFMESGEGEINIIIAASISIIMLFVAFFAVIYYVNNQCIRDKKVLQETVAQNQLAPDLELATLQELPRHGNFVHQTNALYNLGDIPADEELIALPQIQRNQIILTKFLGSGAFGEVFEGIAHELEGNSSPLKVAIKTLRKGATEHEKEEFVKEAKLMSNFKHDHILKLLGVCFDNNPNFIILELMEGGDLLSFLRSNRPTIFQQSFLTLDDLLGICVDVAHGCKYLEDMHFVHRDLAARNCLVSSYSREFRVVKIGDFGLARDIYKNDYYRKEGEGLLPVRWMAPESLVYGVFTSQSDVWAFGVLLWEVMTLGQQPYPARANIEVLNYVRAGGRLDKPENCPEDLHEVMTSCWCYDPEGRPSFNYCLDALRDLRQKIAFLPISVNPVHHQNYLSSIHIGFDNLAYNGEEQCELIIPELEEAVPQGAYITANSELNERHEKFTTGQDMDSFSTHSDPILSLEMLQHQELVAKRAMSLTHIALHQENEPSSLSMTICSRAGVEHQQKEHTNKYLELLADNEDVDGYEIPLRATIPMKDLDNCKKGYSNKPLCKLTSSDNSTFVTSNPCHDSEESISPVVENALCVACHDELPKILTLNSLSRCVNTPMFDFIDKTLDASKENFTERTNEAEFNCFFPFEKTLKEKYTTDSETASHCVCLSDSIGRLKICNRCIYNKTESLDNIECVEKNHWSSSASSSSSTLPLYTESKSNYSKNNRISSLSSSSGVELNYSPKSSCC